MNTKKLLTFVAKLVVTLLVFVWIDRTFGFPQIIKTLATADWAWFVLAIIMHIASIFLGAWQWGIILKNRGLSMPIWETIKLYYTGMFFNNFILGTVAGDSFKVAVIHKKKKNAKSGFAATFLDRFVGLAVLSVFALIGAGVMIFTRVENNQYMYMSLLVVLFFSLLLLGVFLLIFSKRAQTLFSKALLKFPNSDIAKKAEGVISSVYMDRRGGHDSKMLAQIFSLSFLIQTLRISTHIFCAVALSIFTFSSIQYFFVIVPITAILMIVPLPFGLIPAIAGAIFAGAGFNQEQATVMQFLAAIAGVIGSMAGAVFFLTDNSRK